ncbi:tetratricopeptide repeat protein [Shouchella sp. JSM 1781072]|uniref:response regulator aspartate phosphatase n=1 Tax=Shouchella sp. JSM 1781072 TaxID=3344581 RepID=UPI0035C12398
MCTKKIPSAKVGAKIVEWYSCILSSSYEEATLLKHEVEQMLKRMEEDDKILAYYSLVAYRHDNMMDGDNRSISLEEELNHVEKDMDQYLKYLYYFVSGQNEYNNQRYRSAVKLFRKAERMLEFVDDKTEEYEFYMYMGIAYYRINQYLLATSYLEQAETGFRRLNFPKKYLNSKQVLGAIYSELKEYDKAEDILNEALQECTFPLYSGIILRTLGLSMFSQKKYDSAVSFFEKSLDLEEYNDSIFGMRSRTELAHTLFKLNKHEEAQKILKGAKASANYYNELEFKVRCQFIEGTYVCNDQKMVDNAIQQLNKAGLHFEVCELSEELIEIYEEKGDNKNIIKYFKSAYQGKINQTLLGDDQV